MFRDTTIADNTRESAFHSILTLKELFKTSFGPCGLDKMINTDKLTILTNDGATIARSIQPMHPISKLLVNVSTSQETECGDGTTGVLILSGALIDSLRTLISRGVASSILVEALLLVRKECHACLESIAIEADASKVSQCVRTTLSSKVVAGNAGSISQLAIEAIGSGAKITKPRDLRIHTSVGLVESSRAIDGVVLQQPMLTPTRKLQNVKIALIQFCLSPPKPDTDSTIYVQDYEQIDRVVRQEREYQLRLCKAIKNSGATLLLIQKSILRETITSTSLSYLTRLGVSVVSDIERKEIEALCEALGTTPVADVETLNPQRLGYADLVMVEEFGEEERVVISGLKSSVKSVVLCGVNSTVSDEVRRSFDDAAAVAYSLALKNKVVCGGGSVQARIALWLRERSKTMEGMMFEIVRELSRAFELIPEILAENSGLDPIEALAELKLKSGTYGISTKRGVSDMLHEGVFEPLHSVNTMVDLAIEAVIQVLRIDGIVQTKE